MSHRRCTNVADRPEFQVEPFSPLPPKSVVALGKFDALHLGHQQLAVCARDMGCDPCLLSFSGMAEVLNWEPRLPLVAPRHRAAVLESWGGGVRELVLPFAKVRNLSPSEFVDLLADVLKVRGAVCGENFRFGKRAVGTDAALKQLGEQRGLNVTISPLKLSDKKEAARLTLKQAAFNLFRRRAQDPPAEGEPVSSSRVREALASGDLEAVCKMLGRPHVVSWEVGNSGPKGMSLIHPANQPPGIGSYTVSVCGDMLRDESASLCLVAGLIVDDEGFFIERFDALQIGIEDCVSVGDRISVVFDHSADRS